MERSFAEARAATAALRARAHTYLADADLVSLPISPLPSPLHRSVLIVEDEEATARVVARALRAALPGVEVYAVGTLAEARTALAAGPVGVLLIDMGLPDGDGWTLAAWVSSRCYVVLMSGSIEADEVAALMSATGARAALAKPFSLDEVVGAVGAAWAGEDGP